MKSMVLYLTLAVAAPSFAGSPFACNRTALTAQARKRHLR